MVRDYLEFERPVAELELKIDELQALESNGDVTFTEEIYKLQQKVEVMKKVFFLNYHLSKSCNWLVINALTQLITSILFLLTLMSCMAIVTFQCHQHWLAVWRD